MPLRVLIADQRSDQIMPLVEFLIGRGIHPVTCPNGGDAFDAIGVQLADQKPFDLVIAHIDLPEIAGMRVLYEARRLHLPTAAALICPSHRVDDKVKGMIQKTGVIAVFEQHIDLARMDRVLKRVVAIRKQEQAKAKERAAAAAQAQAREREEAAAQAKARTAKSEPLIEGFGASSAGGATRMFFGSDGGGGGDGDDMLPPIDGPGGPPSAPTGVHQILPPSDTETASPRMTAKLPPRPKTEIKPPAEPPPQAPTQAQATDGRQRRALGAEPAQATTTGIPKVVQCFRCGNKLKVKSGRGVVSVPCGNCGQVNDVAT